MGEDHRINVPIVSVRICLAHFSVMLDLGWASLSVHESPYGRGYRIPHGHERSLLSDSLFSET
jgi:hypothetical protein